MTAMFGVWRHAETPFWCLAPCRDPFLVSGAMPRPLFGVWHHAETPLWRPPVTVLWPADGILNRAL
jgi:hypothetical protein